MSAPELDPKILDDLMDAMLASEQELLGQRNAVYRERNACVALIARLALSAGYRCGISRDSEREDEFGNVVYIELPTTGDADRDRPEDWTQVSWHISDDELPMFSFLSFLDTALAWKWDEHTTEQKYQRMADFCSGKGRDQ